MSFKPMYDYVLVEAVSNEKTTSSGFIIPEVAQEALNRAVVNQVGPGRVTKEGVFIPVAVTTGDQIVYTGGRGQPVKVDGKQYLVLKEEDIIGVLE